MIRPLNVNRTESQIAFAYALCGQDLGQNQRDQGIKKKERQEFRKSRRLRSVDAVLEVAQVGPGPLLRPSNCTATS